MIRPIRKLLIANRGEIACRIIRTARSMGIVTVAVYSDFDSRALHVKSADEAIRIGPAPAPDSYLNIAAILDAARRSGAGAVHPGYGFLAENAGFAEACAAAGLVFIGPRADVIRKLGMKDSARAAAIAAGVPVVPEYREGDFPVLIKAAAGGGGRGMRVVGSPAELSDAVEAARGEAERAFGNGTLLIERYIQDARHVEVQIFGDLHGNVLHFGERDCSVQRRHQKVIEESPSPAVSLEVRKRMCDAAVALGRAIGYTNAGTVEFLLAPSGEFYFIEVNTRIQVEHAVTEQVRGTDLIRAQIEVAEGRELRRWPGPLGHAIEARLYAEDPSRGFVPTTGTLHVWRPWEGVQVESGVEEGSEISIHYDPLIAKFIAWAADRESAARKLAYALRATAVGAVETNREYLIGVLESLDFLEGRAHTGWSFEWRRDSSHDPGIARAAASSIAAARGSGIPGVPAYWRNNPFRDPLVRVEVAGREHAVPAGDPPPVGWAVHPCGDGLLVHSVNASAVVNVVPRFTRAESSSHQTASSPMPGLVLRVLVEPGQLVKAGDALVVLEAMKMEQTIRTTLSGRVASILVRQGQVVAPGQQLVEVHATGDGDDEHASDAPRGN